MVAKRLIDFPATNWQNPFAAMDQLAKRMDWLNNTTFDRPGLRWFSAKVFPAVNITEDKDKYYVRAELPGIKANEINLEITGKNLSISGERRIQSEKEARYHRRERESGNFSRVIGLPGDIDPDSVNAGMVNGVLMIEIAKSEAAKPKKIMIK